MKTRCSLGLNLLALSFLLMLPEVAFADIPPPLPKVPVVDVNVPAPWQIIVAGLALSLAAVVIGMTFTRKSGLIRRLVVAGAAGVLVLGAAGLFAGWANGQHEEYSRVRSRWRSPGPVRDRWPPPQPPAAPTELPTEGPDGTISGESSRAANADGDTPKSQVADNDSTT